MNYLQQNIITNNAGKNFIKIFLISIIVFLGCKASPNKSLLNTSHLDHLYQEIEINNQSAAFVCIYSDYPTYAPVEALGEGLACVDDVARAAILYFRYFQKSRNAIYLHKAKKLIRFIIELQSKNGFFYNFISVKNVINKTRVNSQAKADWWSWRAMWALAEAMHYAKTSNQIYYKELENVFMRTLNALVDSGGEHVWENIPGDQASVLLISLTSYYNVSSNKLITGYISSLANTLMNRQKGDSEKSPYYAFMSWKNEWHAWGNAQSYALLKAGQILDDKKMIAAAANEINFFYPYILKQGFLKQFKLDKNDEMIDVENFEQIAYAVRPMVWASLELYKITKDSVHALQAGKLAAWLFGANVANYVIYDATSGRCYDGIDSARKINLNSGAESTIEALLTILEVEKNPIANNYLQSVYRKTLNE